MFLWGPENILWALLLGGSVATSIGGILWSGLFNQAAKQRRYNRTKLFNECVGKHQLAYLMFFANMSIGGKFDPHYPWVKYLVWFGASISFIFYGYGLYSTAVQDRVLSKYNRDVKLPKWEAFRIWRLNLLFAVLSLGAGVVFSTMIRP